MLALTLLWFGVTSTDLTAAAGTDLSRQCFDDARNRIREANRRESAAWRKVGSRDEWEAFRQPRLRSLRASLGSFLESPKDLRVRITRTWEGDSFRVENVLFESRPGVTVSVNVYAPVTPRDRMPGLVICHSHHTPKTDGELQDMGMTWARAGCVVVVPDQLGHGERRLHPFHDASAFPRPFRAGRQDYWFRYNSGLQLQLLGESLAGWMAWDMSRCVDLLLARPGIDRERIALLGSVAGGGDPTAVAAAIDPRVTVAVVFNFGGPQPETTYPLPADAETSFNYAGGGSWESTRNLRHSCRDGFLPWEIVATVAPRRFVYAHEFSWDRDRDPVWKRLQTVYGWYDGRDRLAFTTGRGRLTGQAPESTHCNHIGAEHRRGIHAALQAWWGLATPEEYRKRVPASDLLCLPSAEKPAPLHDVWRRLGEQQIKDAQGRLERLSPDERVARLRDDWSRVLGGVEPARAPKLLKQQSDEAEGVVTERWLLEVDDGVAVPAALLRKKGDGKRPVVVCVCQQGKQEFLTRRAAAVKQLLDSGAAVCLLDVRGTGEGGLKGDSRGRSSASTALAASELMLGRTLLGLRVRDVRSVLRHLRSRDDVDGGRMSVWGESFAAVNDPDDRVAVPHDADPAPRIAEPLGALLATFVSLFEPDVKAFGRGGIAGYDTLLASPFLHVPADVVVPGALNVGDLGEISRAVPRLRQERLVDGLNRRVGGEGPDDRDVVRWMLR